MELHTCQVVFVMTMLYGGFDARPTLSRQTEIMRQPLDIEGPRQTELNRTEQEKKKVRHRRYVLQGSRWYKNPITWTIPSDGWCSTLTNTKVKDTITKAFRMWAEVCPLKFRWVSPSSSADITVAFKAGYYHSNTGSFDGPGGILARATFPNAKDVYIHFDDDESWTVSGGNGNTFSLLPVAVHEMGHTLGLAHSTVPGSIMNPTYSNKNANIQLGDDDVKAVQDYRLYGECYTRVAAINTASDRRTYIFNGLHSMWRYDNKLKQSDRGYPKPISSKWRRVPGDVDEMFRWPRNGATYFFKGTQYYKINDANNSPYWWYPLDIARYWPGLPRTIDAASEFDDGRSYFFKGDLVYKYNDYYDRVEPGWPRKISWTFPGLPNNIDSVFYNKYVDRKVYIFKNEYYYEYTSSYGSRGPYLIPRKWKNICEV